MKKLSKIETDFLGNNVKDVDLKEKEIRKFETIFPSAKVIRDKYETEAELEHDWQKFKGLPYSIKVLANDKCLRYFGRRNPQMYIDMKRKFLTKDIDNKEIDNTYRPANLVEDHSVLEDTLIEEDTVPESVSELAIENIYDYVNGNSNLIETAILLDAARTTASTPVEKTIYNEMKSQFNKRINSRGVVLLDNTIGMTDEEVLKSLDTQGKARMLEDTDFIAFQARLLGIDPDQSNVNRQDFVGESTFNKLKHGWNPIIKFNSRNCKNANRRMNRILNDNCKFKFIPIQEVEVNPQKEFEPKRGISILIIRDLEPTDEFEKNNSKVFLTLDPKNPNWYEFRNGSFITKSNVQSTLDAARSGMVNVYFVELSDNLYSKMSGVISGFNRIYNKKIKEVISKLKSTVPNVGNSHLFVINLLTSIFSNKFGSDNDKTAIYTIYSGLNPSSYQEIEDAYQKLNIFTEYTTLTNSSFLEDTFKPNILAELPISNMKFFEDSKEFINKESVDFDSEYQHIHRILQVCKESKDTEAMKYYAAKLFYMNSLLENKLYFQENGPTIDLSSLYHIRGNILQEANRCVANIIEIDPKFDIEEYYSSTLFETSNSPKKKFNFTEAFSNIKNMISNKIDILKL